MLIWEIALIFAALGIIIAAFGYNLALPGYSRRRLLEGESVRSQIYRRSEVGAQIMHAGAILIAITILFALVICMFIPVESKEVAPKEVSVMVAQGKTMIIIDGCTYTYANEYSNINRVYLIDKINCYGIKYWQTVIIEDKDQWAR